ncbi:MAG: hypothetical protein WC867_02695 [Candidatus Pacearchaeota archaeon]
MLKYQDPIHERKINNYLILLIILSVLIITGFFIYKQYKIINYGTNPKDLKNYTRGELNYEEKNYLEFKDYYLIVKGNSGNIENNSYNKNLTRPKLEFEYNFYNKKSYFDYCTAKKVDINFTNPKFSNFSFNYNDKKFFYNIDLYKDLYKFSEDLKNQDCYYLDEKDYPNNYLKDPYNNEFMEIVSEDFISLRKKGFSDDEIVEISSLFVQSITYGTDITEMNRYPYETFYEQKGNCLDKSLILIGILKKLGYKSYIILGHVDKQYHALVGIDCKSGNIIENGSNICFIETTVFSPISESSDIDIEKIITVSSGNKIYSDVNYGNALVGKIENQKNNSLELEYELETISSELKELRVEMNDIDSKICETDCAKCEKGINQMVIKSYAGICDDADLFNQLAKDYNEKVSNHNIKVREYNQKVEEWYKIYYEIEKSMFGNIIMIERKNISEPEAKI